MPITLIVLIGLVTLMYFLSDDDHRGCLFLVFVWLVLTAASSIGCTHTHFRTTSHLRVNTNDSIQYRVFQTRWEGERQLLWLANTTDTEEAWIYGRHVWYEIGINADGDTVYRNQRSVALAVAAANAVHRYHIHPLLDIDVKVAKSRGKIQHLDSSIQAMLIKRYIKYQENLTCLPSHTDLFYALKNRAQYKGRFPYSSSVVTPWGIVRIIPEGPVKPVYKQEALAKNHREALLQLALQSWTSRKHAVESLSVPGSYRFQFIPISKYFPRGLPWDVTTSL